MVVVDRGELERLPGAIETYRAALRLASGDLSGTIEHAGLAVNRAVADDHLTRAAATALSGLASWAGGDLDAAHRGYSAAALGLRRIGHVSDVLGCSITLADIEITQGRLRQAGATYERALELARHERPGLRGTADMYVGLSRLAWERNDLDTAYGYLRRGEELGAAADLPQKPYRWRVALARIREAEGDLAAARDLLDEATRVYVADYSPNVRPLPALRARLLIGLGDLSGAQDWARQHDLSADDELSYLREYEHVTLARFLLAQHRIEGSRSVQGDVDRLLERLLADAEAGGRTGAVIEVLVLQALAAHSRGDVDAAALAPLERALTLAEPERYVRTFISEGTPMTSLLEKLERRRPDWAYPRALLDSARRPENARASRQPPAAQQGLVDTLSDRELDVLRLLATDLDGPAIARELVVSLNTVRTHTKHIYAKLAVNNRRAAVRQAHQLKLLSRSGNR